MDTVNEETEGKDTQLSCVPTPYEAVEVADKNVVRVTWEPTDASPSEELERLMTGGDFNVAPTNAQAAISGVQRSYLFTNTGKWYGLILPKVEWENLVGGAK